MICTDNCDFVPSFFSSANSTLNQVNQDSSDLDIETESDLNASTVENTLTPIEIDHIECTFVLVEQFCFSWSWSYFCWPKPWCTNYFDSCWRGSCWTSPCFWNDKGLDFINTTWKSYWQDQKKIQRQSKNMGDKIKKIDICEDNCVFKGYSKENIWCFSPHNMWKCVWGISLSSLYREFKNIEQRKEVSHMPSATLWRIWQTITKTNLSGLVDQETWHKTFKENNFEEIICQNKLPIETQLPVYNTLHENSIVSTNGRNDRNKIDISKRQYLQWFLLDQKLLGWNDEEKKQKGKDNSLWPKKYSNIYSKNVEIKDSGEKHWC